MASPRSGGASPRSGDVSPRTPSALRNELGAAKRAVEVLKAEKQNADEKLEKLHAVLEKEREALRDVLASARLKVDDLNQQCATKDAEIERLKALLANQSNVPAVDTSQFTTQIELLTAQNTELDNRGLKNKKRISELEGLLAEANSAKANGANSAGADKAELERLRAELNRMQQQANMQAAASQNASVGDKDALMKQLTSLREQLQSQSKIFSEQMDAGRKREEDLRQQLVKQRQEMAAELADLRSQLSKALENENAYKVEQLSKQLVRMRREFGLRQSNGLLLRERAVNRSNGFHYWRYVTSLNNAEKKLSSEARFKLESARAKADGKSLFGATPLMEKHHMQSRDASDTANRYELWENMTPRGGRGDGRDTSISQSPRSSPNPSPARGRPSPKFGSSSLGMGGAVGRSMGAGMMGRR